MTVFTSKFPLREERNVAGDEVRKETSQKSPFCFTCWFFFGERVLESKRARRKGKKVGGTNDGSPLAPVSALLVKCFGFSCLFFPREYNL